MTRGHGTGEVGAGVSQLRAVKPGPAGRSTLEPSGQAPSGFPAAAGPTAAGHRGRKREGTAARRKAPPPRAPAATGGLNIPRAGERGLPTGHGRV